MTTTQRAVLDTYFLTFGRLPLRKIASHTGIQTSRVYRILNGHEMKLSEYEKFQQSICQKSTYGELEDILKDSGPFLTERMRDEIKKTIERLVKKRMIHLQDFEQEIVA